MRDPVQLVPHLSTFKMNHDEALYKCLFAYLLTSLTHHCCVCCSVKYSQICCLSLTKYMYLCFYEIRLKWFGMVVEYAGIGLVIEKLSVQFLAILLRSGVTIGRARRAVHMGPALWGPKICPTLFFLKLCWGRGGPFGILAHGPTATLLRDCCYACRD